MTANSHTTFRSGLCLSLCLFSFTVLHHTLDVNFLGGLAFCKSVLISIIERFKYLSSIFSTIPMRQKFLRRLLYVYRVLFIGTPVLYLTAFYPTARFYSQRSKYLESPLYVHRAPRLLFFH